MMITMETALILCESGFGRNVGKTANGLVRFSRKYKVVGVIDSSHAGTDAGVILEGKENGIRIHSSIDDALRHGEKPDWLVIGVATIGGFLPQDFRRIVQEAIEKGIGVISGLHEELANDPELSRLAEESGVEIRDIRRPPPFSELHHFANRAASMDALRIPVLGMDGSIGKRTTGWILWEALQRRGVKSVFVATGQTGLLQGADYGLPLDAIGGDFMVGELEHQICLAYEEERPEIIIIEGQGSISHPAYVCGSRAIITASSPSGIVLQCAPGREYRSYHREELHIPMPPIETEMRLLESFAGCDVIALTVNPEGLTEGELDDFIVRSRSRYGITVCDPVTQGCGGIVDRIQEIL
jgi:uncharacterized NAD-dependent epimerase/dehydratase family protein